jgi:hypothetical protein
MPFTETEAIMRRVEAALEYDLLGRSDAPSAAQQDANGALSEPLNSRPVCERVERFVLDPVGAGDLYAATQRTGMTVGYGFNTQTPSGPQTGTGQSADHTLNLGVTIIRVVDSAQDLLDGTPGFDADALMDDIYEIFGTKRRKAQSFGAKTVSLGAPQKLEGGTASAPWAGRVIPIKMRRSYDNHIR